MRKLTGKSIQDAKDLIHRFQREAVETLPVELSTYICMGAAQAFQQLQRIGFVLPVPQPEKRRKKKKKPL